MNDQRIKAGDIVVVNIMGKDIRCIVTKNDDGHTIDCMKANGEVLAIAANNPTLRPTGKTMAGALNMIFTALQPERFKRLGRD